jgi:hypothetical protein
LVEPALFLGRTVDLVIGHKCFHLL